MSRKETFGLTSPQTLSTSSRLQESTNWRIKWGYVELCKTMDRNKHFPLKNYIYNEDGVLTFLSHRSMLLRPPNLRHRKCEPVSVSFQGPQANRTPNGMTRILQHSFLHHMGIPCTYLQARKSTGNLQQK